MAAKAYAIPREEVWRVWPGVAEWIDSAYKAADEIMPLDILDQLRSGHRQLWVAWGDEQRVLCAVLTRIVQLRSGRALQVTGCGGEQVERWSDLITTLESFAKDEGCTKIQVSGRPGWARLYRNSGYRATRVVIEREL